MKIIGCCNWKLLSFKWGLTRRYLCSHEPTLNVLISPKTDKVKIPFFFKPVKLLNKIVYFYELKLLQKRKLSQLQICYLWIINRNMTWWKKSLTFTSCNTNRFDTTCTIHALVSGELHVGFKYSCYKSSNREKKALLLRRLLSWMLGKTVILVRQFWHSFLLIAFIHELQALT